MTGSWLICIKADGELSTTQLIHRSLTMDEQCTVRNLRGIPVTENLPSCLQRDKLRFMKYPGCSELHKGQNNNNK